MLGSEDAAREVAAEGSSVDTSTDKPVGSWPRVRCCNGKSYCYFCPVCCSPLGTPQGVTVPRVRLPLQVSVLLRDGQQRTTSLHAKVLAPDDVEVHACFGSHFSVPEFDPERTVVALPSDDSCTWDELDDLENIERVVVLCSPWQQIHKFTNLPQVRRLRKVRVGGTAISSGFWRIPPSDTGTAGSHLSTIEALVHLLREFKVARHAPDPSLVEDELRFDLESLLFFFHIIRDTIKERGSIGRCGPSGPFNPEGRETFRAKKIQKKRSARLTHESTRGQPPDSRPKTR
mmetsp:Transcript_11041/g.34076  ORF Transcript_11041/g.34076 Transcript_11041/m.34076 type:complete len:288 (-) Transcript_11041:23-886(-)